MKIAIAVILALPAVSLAQQIAIGEFPLPQVHIVANGITTGPDGALWFTGLPIPVGGVIGRISPAGAVTLYNLPTPNAYPWGITKGPGGALWFTEYTASQIGRITTSGAITEYPLATGTNPRSITLGPDDALWFTEYGGNKIGRITTAGVVTEYPIPTADTLPWGITTGPDHALWFVEEFGNNVGRVSLAGDITEYPISSTVSWPHDITTGPDGALWFTEEAGRSIGRVTTAGVVTEYPLPSGGSSWGITATSSGLWFTETGGTLVGGAIGSITTSGTFAEYPVPVPKNFSCFPNEITVGPSGNLWFADTESFMIGEALFPAASLSVTPASGYINSRLTFTGSGFAPNETVLIYTVGVGSSALATATADATGSVTATAGAPESVFGPRLFIGKGQTSGNVGAANFSMMPRLILNPASGPAGTRVTVEGYGNEQADAVNIYWGIAPHTLLGVANADVHGGFTGSGAFTFTVPADAPAGKTGVFGIGDISGAVGRGSFTVQ